MGNNSAYADGFERRSCTVDDAWMAQASSSACTTAVPYSHGNVMLSIVLTSWRSPSSRPEHRGGYSCRFAGYNGGSSNSRIIIGSRERAQCNSILSDITGVYIQRPAQWRSDEGVSVSPFLLVDDCV
ncbi:hypothetical protein C8R45DRAFT_1101612 [Mycena sanguinolenta]|nr:hypothetical protein C8R45DRAFT_1101612 [Mycena sanguinolenta]